MKDIKTNEVSFFDQIPGACSEWYYGLSREQGDLYEAEELFRSGHPVEGNTLCLVRYPDGTVHFPCPKTDGTYTEEPVYLDGCIYYFNADFRQGVIRIFCFRCDSAEVSLAAELPMDSVTNCYNLKLHTAPLCLTRQGDDGMFEILWPERISFRMRSHESFFLREGGLLYFSKWHEKGKGANYRYWEETVARDLSGKLLEVLPGDVRLMPNGELWHLY